MAVSERALYKDFKKMIIPSLSRQGRLFVRIGDRLSIPGFMKLYNLKASINKRLAENEIYDDVGIKPYEDYKGFGLGSSQSTRNVKLCDRKLKFQTFNELFANFLKKSKEKKKDNINYKVIKKLPPLYLKRKNKIVEWEYKHRLSKNFLESLKNQKERRPDFNKYRINYNSINKHIPSIKMALVSSREIVSSMRRKSIDKSSILLNLKKIDKSTSEKSEFQKKNNDFSFNDFIIQKNNSRKHKAMSAKDNSLNISSFKDLDQSVSNSYNNISYIQGSHKNISSFSYDRPNSIKRMKYNNFCSPFSEIHSICFEKYTPRKDFELPKIIKTKKRKKILKVSNSLFSDLSLNSFVNNSSESVVQKDSKNS